MTKQYRYINAELRADKSDHKLAGYFAVFGSEYRMTKQISETVDPHAFDETLQEDNGDIRCLWNHNADIVLGRTGAGSLSLRVDEHGLYGEVTINPDDSDAMNALARIRRGDVSQCSIGFEILSETATTREHDVLFTVNKVKLWEVSPVTFPAYQETAISARQQDADHVRQRELDAWKLRIKEKLNGTKSIDS